MPAAASGHIARHVLYVMVRHVEIQSLAPEQREQENWQ